MRWIIVAATLTVVLPLSAAWAQNAPDADSQKFIKAAIEGNNAEIAVGKLAQQKGKNAAVKQFGSMMVAEHSKANIDAKSAAKSVKVTPPSGTSLMQKGTYAKLKLLSGDTFDRSFANTMVSDHQSNIEEYKKVSGKGDAVGQYAKKTLPNLENHLAMAQKLQDQVKSK